MDNPEFEPHFSRVMEVRKWFDRTPPFPNDPVSTAPEPVHNEPEDFVQERQSSLFVSGGLDELQCADSGMAEAGDLASTLRTKISQIAVHTTPPRIPDHVVVDALRGVIKPACMKHGARVPSNYKDATNLKNPDAPAWKAEMIKEIEDLSALGAFRKGLTASDSPTDVPLADVIRSLWAHDIKVDGRKRARFAARGDVENNPPDDDRFSPVLQMRSARVVIAVAAQLNMQLVTLDFPKAFLLGKMDAARPIFMHAPQGFEKFPGEIYEILLPLYGLTVSSRRFYEL
jgi:hypothetical protein